MDVAARIEAVDRQCRKAGRRFTGLRRDVLARLLLAGVPLKAYELLRLLRSERPGAQPPTVYRALEFLVDVGAVHRIDAIHAFVACVAPGHNHEPQLLLCDRCHRVVELDLPSLGTRLARAARRHGFVAQVSACVVSGTCTRCVQAVACP